MDRANKAEAIPLIFMFLIDMVRWSRVGRSAKNIGKKEKVGQNV